MDAKEAIEHMKNVRQAQVNRRDEATNIEDKESNEHGIDMIDTCISALEKQMPKEPINIHEDLDYEGFDIEVGGCPNCIGDVVKGEHNCCPYCGQYLDWSSDKE